MIEEVYKDIPGYNGIYKASNLGNIKSLKYGKEKILKPWNSNDYLQIILCYNNIKKKIGVHRLIAQTFIDNIDNKTDINHINGIKNDNRVENLEWSTKSENSNHMFYTLGKNRHLKENHPMLGKFGINNSHSKKVQQISLKGELIKIWDSMKDIERELGIRQTMISDVCRGRYGCKTSRGFIWKFN